MASLPSYRYNRLESAEHIRLLELLPRDQTSSLLTCYLHPKTLSEASDTYTAISYAWGDWKPEDLKPIILDGCTASITENLYSALSRLRYESTSRLLWVDALCIDQSREPEGLRERAQQVLLMSRIFPGAKTVVVDLGEIHDDDAILMNLFTEIAKFDDEEWKILTSKFKYMRTAGEIYEISSGHGVLNPQSIAAQKYFSSLPSGKLSTAWENSFRDQELWISLKRFMNRAWFSRLWVVQEFALGKEIQVLLGSELRPVTFLSSIFLRIITHASHLMFTDSNLFRDWDKNSFLSKSTSANIERIVGIRHLLAQRHKFTFGFTFHQTLLFKCTDTRDKVYGILGLVTSEEQIDVDYNHKIRDVALDASRTLISLGDSVYMLYHCIGCKALGPSWAVDLLERKTDILAVMMTPMAEPYSLPYNACGSKPAKIRTTPSSLSLHARGYILDSIAECTSALVDSTDAEDTYHARIGWQIETAEWIEKHSINSKSFAIDGFTTIIADLLIMPQPTRGRRNPTLLAQLIKAYTEFLTMHRGRATTAVQRDQMILNARPYLGSLTVAFNRRLAITSEHKLCCLIPRDAEIDDRICILLGCPIPFVIRREGEGWRIVGCCYVHRFMDGEILESKNWTEQYITIC